LSGELTALPRPPGWIFGRGGERKKRKGRELGGGKGKGGILCSCGFVVVFPRVQGKVQEKVPRSGKPVVQTLVSD